MGGKSKAQTIGYHYKWAMHFAWCRAADALLELRGGGATAFAGRVTANTVLSINKPELWGGEKGQGGIVSDFEVLFGADDQAPSAYLSSTFGEKQSGNRGLVSTILKGGRYGAFMANPKNMTAKFERIHADGMGWYPETAAVFLGEEGDESLGVAYDAVWQYRVEEPGSTADYSSEHYDHSGWPSGPGGFGTAFSGKIVGTYVDDGLNKAIWLRRRIVGLNTTVDVEVDHDDRADIWWNGELVGSAESWGGTNITVPLEKITGDDVIAVKVVDSAGGGNIYVGVEMAWAAPLAKFRAMNGAHMIYEALCHDEMAGEPVGLINDDSFRAAAAKLYDEGIGLCTTYDSDQETHEQFIQRVCNVIGAACSQSRIDGQYYLDLIRGDYDIDSLPLITDSEIIDFKASPAVANETFNAVRVEWTDPAAGDTRTTAPVAALGRVRDAGETIEELRRYPEVPTESIALRLAQRDVDAGKPTLTKYELTVTRKHRELREGQPFRVQLPKRGIAEAVLRLGSIRHGTHLDGRVKITALQDVFSLPETVTVEPSPGEWVAPSKIPVVPPAQVAFEAPYVELISAMSTADFNALEDDTGFLLTAAALPSAGINYTIASAAGSEDYVDRATADFCPTALVVEAAPLEGPPRTEFTLSDGSLLDRVEIGSWALWNDEIVRVDAIDAAAATCTLGRGCADTVVQDHAASERIWFCGDWVGSDGREYVDAEDVKAKLLTRTTSGQLELSSGVESAVTLDQRILRPYPPGKLRITDAETADMAYPGEASGQLTVSWAHRDRLLQADQLIAEGEDSIGPEDGTTYTVRYYLDDVLDETESGITGTSATPYTISGDGTARVEVEAERDGLTSWQAATAEFAYATVVDVRVTDAGDTRTTDAGDRRILE